MPIFTFTSYPKLLSALFFVAACLFTSGIIGIIVGFQVISPGGHGLAQLGAYFYGMPLGALTGLLLGLFFACKLSPWYRFCVGSCILFAGAGMALSIYLLLW